MRNTDRGSVTSRSRRRWGLRRAGRRTHRRLGRGDARDGEQGWPGAALEERGARRRESAPRSSRVSRGGPRPSSEIILKGYRFGCFRQIGFPPGAATTSPNHLPVRPPPPDPQGKGAVVVLLLRLPSHLPKPLPPPRPPPLSSGGAGTGGGGRGACRQSPYWFTPFLAPAPPRPATPPPLAPPPSQAA